MRSLLTLTLLTLVVCPRAHGEETLINGMKMYYEVHGEGEPLLLLHWYTSSGERSWGPFIQEFAKHYRVVVPDMRGHGRSINPDATFTHRQSANDMFCLLNHLGIDRFCAMGVSSGGMTLLHMATQEPSRIQSMVLVGTTHYFPEQARQIMRRETAQFRKNDDKWWALNREIHSNDAQIDKMREIFHNFKDSYNDMNFTQPYLSTIRAKTLIIHGDRDEFFPITIPVELYNSIPNAALWIVPNAGHIPHIDGVTAEPTELPFAEKTLRFLSD